MHIEKNVCDILNGTLLGDPKSKDNVDAHLDLIDLGIQYDLHSKKLDNGCYTMPDACFTMYYQGHDVGTPEVCSARGPLKHRPKTEAEV
jgi:hypothetical protein